MVYFFINRIHNDNRNTVIKAITTNTIIFFVFFALRALSSIFLIFTKLMIHTMNTATTSKIWNTFISLTREDICSAGVLSTVTVPIDCTQYFVCIWVKSLESTCDANRPTTLEGNEIIDSQSTVMLAFILLRPVFINSILSKINR